MAKAKNIKNEEVDQKSKTRTTVFIENGLLDKLNYINYKDSNTRTDIVNDALSDYVARWEEKNGEIPKR